MLFIDAALASSCPEMGEIGQYPSADLRGTANADMKIALPAWPSGVNQALHALAADLAGHRNSAAGASGCNFESESEGAGGDGG
jgi:hypothetical protein